MNLLDVIKDQFSSEMIGKLGSLIGESPEKTQSAVGASIPAILSGLMKLGSTPSGADKLHQSLKPSNLPSMGDLGSVLSGDTSGLVQKGLALLSTLFGDSSVGAIIASLSKFSGIGGPAAKKLLGLLLPMILSTIASKAGGMNAQGLVSMLAGQKDNITKGLPAGFSLPNIQGLASTELPAAPGLPKWLLPLVGLAALAGLAYFFLPAAEPVPDVNVDAPVVKDAPKVELPKVELPKVEVPDAVTVGKDFTSMFATLTDTFGGIKDAATAEAALPMLKESDSKFDALKVLFDKILADARAKVVEVIKTSLDKLKELTTKILAMPGVSEKIKPVVDELLKKLVGLAG